MFLEATCNEEQINTCREAGKARTSSREHAITAKMKGRRRRDVEEENNEEDNERKEEEEEYV